MYSCMNALASENGCNIKVLALGKRNRNLNKRKRKEKLT